jgi:hypothetical protein
MAGFRLVGRPAPTTRSLRAAAAVAELEAVPKAVEGQAVRAVAARGAAGERTASEATPEAAERQLARARRTRERRSMLVPKPRAGTRATQGTESPRRARPWLRHQTGIEGRHCSRRAPFARTLFQFRIHAENDPHFSRLFQVGIVSAQTRPAAVSPAAASPAEYRTAPRGTAQRRATWARPKNSLTLS